MTKPSRPIRTFFAGIFLILGAVLGAFSLISHWLNNSILDSRNFAATYSELPADPTFQHFLAANVANFAEKQITESGLASTTSQATEELSNLLDLIPGASPWKDSIDTLPDDITQSANKIVYDQTIELLKSDTFPTLWNASLEEIHGQLINLLEGNQGLTYIDGVPYLSLEIGPITNALREAMASEGLWFAVLIPDIAGTIPIVAINHPTALQDGYQLLNNLNDYLPLLTAAAVLLGLALAPKPFLAISGGGLLFSAASAAIAYITPTLSGRFFQAIGSEDAQAISVTLWDLATAPLISAATLTLQISLAVTLLGLVGAVISSAVSRSRNAKTEAV